MGNFTLLFYNNFPLCYTFIHSNYTPPFFLMKNWFQFVILMHNLLHNHISRTTIYMLTYQQITHGH
jgi:hypothetical protein